MKHVSRSITSPARLNILHFKASVTAMLVPLAFVMLYPLSVLAGGDIKAYVGATLFIAPDQEPVENGIIITHGNVISQAGESSQIEVPAQAVVIDVSGQFICAGFWNSHVHYTGVLHKAAEEDAASLGLALREFFHRWGFTATVDTGSHLENTLLIKKRIQSGDVPGPQILTTGSGFVPVGGSPYYLKPVTLPAFTSPAQAGQLVSEILLAGADGIKLFTGSWGTPQQIVTMSAAHVRAATRQAHAKKAWVFAHPSDSDGARVAIENGVDALAHTFPAQMHGPWDPSLIDLMAEKDVALIPTLKLWRYVLTKEGLPEAVIDIVEQTALRQVKLANEKGVRLLFGTDVGFMRDADTTAEFKLLARAGLSYQAILAMLTTAPASQYGLAQSQGKIRQNFMADLVVLNSDPRESVLAFSDVDKTIRHGKLVYQQ